LKQLFYLVGEDNFFAGIQKYFTAFAWENANIDNLL
jgi:aminopeptidase N